MARLIIYIFLLLIPVNNCAEAQDPQVNALLQIAGELGSPAALSNDWKGNDACDGWSFITCDAQKKNITAVDFSYQNFVGTISAAFGKLTSLKDLYLNDNHLFGPIPESLARLPQLEVLYVNNNNLSGEVPKFPPSVKLFTKPGNPFLGTDITGGSQGPSSGPSSSGSGVYSGGTIAGIIVAAFVSIAISCFILYKIKNQKRNFESKGEGYRGRALNKKADGIEIAGIEGDHQISIEVLTRATGHFCEDNIIGTGGFAVVYKGELDDGTKIAVKRIKSDAMGSSSLNGFEAEIEVLTKVRHRHLVSFLGYCVSGNERLLVYEYIPQGTLAKHLERHNLTWQQRVTIALDVARAIEYLHGLAVPQKTLIHRDLKPDNILLDQDMRAKVADFGLVKNALDGVSSVETRLMGSHGYLDPEYAATGKLTKKADVYAFGVILIQLITGKKAVDKSMPDERPPLVIWFHRIVLCKEDIQKAVDEPLNLDEESLSSIYIVAELAKQCTASKQDQRPNMMNVVHVLGPLVEKWVPAVPEEENTRFPEALQKLVDDEEGSATLLPAVRG